MTDRRTESWRFSREIPITVLIAFAVQAVGVIWWAQGLTKEVESNRRRIEMIEAQRVSERLTTLESQMLDTKGALQRIEAKLDRLVEKEVRR